MRGGVWEGWRRAINSDSQIRGETSRPKDEFSLGHIVFRPLCDIDQWTVKNMFGTSVLEENVGARNYS